MNYGLFAFCWCLLQVFVLPSHLSKLLFFFAVGITLMHFTGELAFIMTLHLEMIDALLVKISGTKLVNRDGHDVENGTNHNGTNIGQGGDETNNKMFLQDLYDSFLAAGFPLIAGGALIYLASMGNLSNHVFMHLIVNAMILQASLLSDNPANFCKTTGRLLLFALYYAAGFHKLNWDFMDPSVSCASQTTASVIVEWLSERDIENLSARWFLQFCVDFAPLGAVVMEFWIFPLLLLAPYFVRSNFVRVKSSQLFIFLGVIFHIFLAIPGPPCSYYPFSMVSLALYPLVIIFDESNPPEILVAYDRQREWLKFLHIIGVLLGIPGVFIQGLIKSVEQKASYEYPPYNWYALGVCWCVAFGGLFVWLSYLPSDFFSGIPSLFSFEAIDQAIRAEEEQKRNEKKFKEDEEKKKKKEKPGRKAVKHRKPAKIVKKEEPTAFLSDKIDPKSESHLIDSRGEVIIDSRMKSRRKFKRVRIPPIQWSSTILPGLLFLMNMLPYLGMRTYAGSFAMFSNLRIEGGTSNHVFFNPLFYTVFFGVGGPPTISETVEILDTNIPDLYNFEVDLLDSDRLHQEGLIDDNKKKDMDQKKTRMQAFSIENPVLYICPPKWNKNVALRQPFWIPNLQLRSVLRKFASMKSVLAYDKRSEFYVKYRKNILATTKKSDLQNGVTNETIIEEKFPFELSLAVKPAWWERIIRYRSFSYGKALCRH